MPCIHNLDRILYVGGRIEACEEIMNALKAKSREYRPTLHENGHNSYERRFEAGANDDRRRGRRFVEQGIVVDDA